MVEVGERHHWRQFDGQLDDPLDGLLVHVEAAVGRCRRAADQLADHFGGDPLGRPRVDGDLAGEQPTDLGRAALGLEESAQNVLFGDSYLGDSLFGGDNSRIH